MPLLDTSVPGLNFRAFLGLEGSGAFLTAVLLSLLTLGAIAADELAAPILYSSSPLWASAGCLLLIWRRGEAVFQSDSTLNTAHLSISRLALFAAAHLVLILSLRALSVQLLPFGGTLTLVGWLMAALKLSVFAPTILLLPLAQWRSVSHYYFAELVAAMVVLLTYFPVRTLDALWPWYGEVLGRTVFHLTKPFVPSLIYIKAFTPALVGPGLDVTILPACSGINGIELFDCLFAFVILLDWNRLRKVRALLAYFGGCAAILLGNAVRIVSLVVLGNHGFADVVARFHISAGWVFFSLVFLVYLSLTYPRLLLRRSGP